MEKPSDGDQAVTGKGKGHISMGKKKKEPLSFNWLLIYSQISNKTKTALTIETTQSK